MACWTHALFLFLSSLLTVSFRCHVLTLLLSLSFAHTHTHTLSLSLSLSYSRSPHISLFRSAVVIVPYPPLISNRNVTRQTSSKTNYNVQLMFDCICESLLPEKTAFSASSSCEFPSTRSLCLRLSLHNAQVQLSQSILHTHARL